MANGVSIECSGCSGACPAVPFPVSELARLASLPNEKYRQFSWDFYQGNHIVVVCQREKKFVKFGFMEESC
jgi:hypothetical protein